MMGISLFLIVYTFPYFMAQAWMAVGNDIYYRLPLEPVPATEIDVFIESREKAIEWTGLDKAKADLTILPLVSDAHRFQSYGAAETLKELLADNPYNGFLWVRLSDLQERIAAPVSDILASWRISYQFMPFEPRVVYSRLYRGLRFREFLTDSDKLLLRGELEAAFRMNKLQLRREIQNNGLQPIVDEYVTSDEMRQYLFTSALK